MPLIHPRVIEKHTKHIAPISEVHEQVLRSWATNLAEGIYDSETQNNHVFIQRILVDVLGYIQSSDGKQWTVAKNQQVGKGNVDVALGEFTPKKTNIIVPFELKGAKTKNLDAIMPGRNKTPVQQAWEYAMDARGAQWVLVSNYREIRLYAVGYGRKDYERFDLYKLFEPDQYGRFMLLLSAENLLSGKTASLLKESEQVDKEITDQLYADYRALRYSLIQTIGKGNPDQLPLEVIRSTQTILDRILFVAFAEDKGLLPEDTLKLAYEDRGKFNPRPVWDNFKGLFNAINAGNDQLNIPAYNGGLFAPNPTIDQLTISDELCEGFKTIGDYAFDSDISVNILGHIFEQSISDLEELKADAENQGVIDKKQSKRKKDSIFYTPPYITRYIVEQAIGGWLNDRKKELQFDKLPELTDDDFDSIKVIVRGKRKGQITYNKKIEKHIDAWEAYKKILSNIKVIDPACGSGAFLNEVFDYLKSEGETVNNQLSDLKGGQTMVFKWDTHILVNNLYGVDLNSESVEITKLSLWLKTANRQEALTYLEDNIKVGNSLIDDSEIAGGSAFHWGENFKSIMDDGGFDVVVGNPPYSYRNAIPEEHKKYYREAYESTEGNYDLYKFFMEKNDLLTKKEGLACFIVPNTFLSAQTYKRLRHILLEKFAIIELFDLGLNVFEDVVVENVIFLLKKTDNRSDTVVKIQRDRSRPVTDYQKKYKVGLLENYSKSENEFNIYVSPEFNPIIEKVEKDNIALSKIAYPTVGINTGYIKSDLIAESKIDSRYHPVLNGKDVDRHTFEWPGKWIMYDPEFVKSKGKLGRTLPPEYIFTSPKILIQRTRRGLKRKLVCYLDKDKHYNLNRLSNVVLEDGSYYLEYIYCILNSMLMDFYFNIKFNEYEVKPTHLSRLPIKPVEKKKQEALKKLAEMVLKAASDLKNKRRKMIVLLYSDFGEFKVSKKMGCWENLEWSEFEKELKNKKIILKGEQKDDWYDRFMRQRSSLIEIRDNIESLDARIEESVCKLYGICSEEKETIQSYYGDCN